MTASRHIADPRTRCAELLAESESILARCGDTMTDADLARIQANYAEWQRLQPGPVLRERSDLIALLRGAGLPRGAAEQIAGGGWLKLRPETQAADLAASLRAAARRLRT